MYKHIYSWQHLYTQQIRPVQIILLYKTKTVRNKILRQLSSFYTLMTLPNKAGKTRNPETACFELAISILVNCNIFTDIFTRILKEYFNYYIFVL